ncbi:MAG: hypothetical protein ACR2ML_00035 [Solirubrobacteraceae bacterium]
MLDAYVVTLAAAPLAAQTRRTYASKVRQYLAWLALAETDGDPLNTADGRDWAVRDYRTHLQAVSLRDRPVLARPVLYAAACIAAVAPAGARGEATTLASTRERHSAACRETPYTALNRSSHCCGCSAECRCA